MDLNDYYQQRINQHQTTFRKLKRYSKWFVISKLILFAAAAFYSYLWLSQIISLWGIFALLCILAFAVVYFLDTLFLKRLLVEKNLLTINKQEQSCINSDISDFDDGRDYIDHDHNYSFDLDIYGKGSIYQALNRTVTNEGHKNLSNWLNCSNVSSSEIVARQEAIKELAPLVDFRQKFRAIGYEKKLDFTAISSKLDKEESFTKPFMIIVWWLVVAATLALTVLSFLDVISYQPVLILFFVQLIMVGSKFKKTNDRYGKLNGYYKTMGAYNDLLKYIDNNKHLLKSDRLKQLFDILVSGDKSTLVAFYYLRKLLGRFDQRNNVIIAIVTNGFLLSDLFLHVRYEKWVTRFFPSIQHYILAIGELEVLLSLSNFSFNNPQFCFPVIDESVIIKADELGHPLLGANSRVNNNLLVSSQKYYHLVTGANMAGKSTFLRTVGVNLVLASIGAPVCAKNFHFQPMTLFSSMRTSDDLVNHVSYFQAELLRLKKLVDVAKKETLTFVILDEILKGTNSKDKLSGSQLFLKRLLEFNASGILATHDLALGKLADELPSNFKNICFEITIEEDEINYDYKLQNGVAKNMNATYLLKRLLLN